MSSLIILDTVYVGGRVVEFCKVENGWKFADKKFTYNYILKEYDLEKVYMLDELMEIFTILTEMKYTVIIYPSLETYSVSRAHLMPW